MRIPDHITCVLQNMYASQEATVRSGHRTMDWFKTGQGVCQGCILSTLFNLYLSYMQKLSVAQSYPTLGNPMDCSPLGSSIHGIARGKNTGVSYHFLLQGIFLTQGSNSGLLNCRRILYCLSHWGICRVHHPKCWGGRITTWNQDCGEKYQ